MANLLVFSAIVSSSPSFVAVAGAAADRLVMEFAVDHWSALPFNPVQAKGLETPSVVPAASTETMVDAPTTLPPVLGEATLMAPSSIFDETEDLREGFVFPLIDPWYESSPLFSPRSLAFSFPVEDLDWIMSGLEAAVDQAWVPNLDEISELLIQKGDIQPVPINFDFLCAASKDWSHWVDQEILDSDFWDNLRDAGVHWSILISRSCNMFRDTEPLRELSTEEEEIAATLRKQSSTRLSGWPSFFVYHKEVSVRRAAFVLYWLYLLLGAFSQLSFCCERQIRLLGTRDYDLVDALDHEENVLFRPYRDDYPGFTCVSVFSRFYQPISLICDLKVQKQFGLDQGVPVGPQETVTCVANLTAFIKSCASARWGGETNRVMIPSGHSWRSSINVVEDRLIMPSKRGKGSKRDAPVDLAVKKISKNPTPSTPSPKKAPSKKTKAGKKGKSTLLVSAPEKKSTTAPVEEPTESTVAPSKVKSVSASLPKKLSKKKKTNVSSSSPDKEQPSAAPTPSPRKKKFVTPLFLLGVASRTRSKSGSKATHGSSRSGGGVVIVEDSDMVVDDVVASPLDGDDLQTAIMDHDKDLRKSVVDSSEASVESTEEGQSSSNDSFFDTTPGSIPKEQIMSAGSTADDDDMPGADDSSMGPADPIGHDLAIVPHASHGRDNDSAVDSDVDPLSFSMPQTVLTSRVTGSDASIAYIMEGISLFGATPRFRAILVGGFVISASRIAGGAFISEGNPCRRPRRKRNTLIGSDHLENTGIDDAVRMSEDAGEVGIIDEITIVSPPLRPTAEAGSSVGASGLSSEVADFLKEFDRKTPNPHPEQFFLRFNGPLVPFGNFWVPNDCLPYLLRLSAGRSDFTTDFKLSAGLSGPMLSLLGSVLAAMSESSLGDVTKTQILAWRSVIQDLMEVGFDLDEVKALQHQIALLQDSLAVLTTYQDEMVSTGRMILGFERGGSFLDNLFD
uniref:Aminotransferase-like plant mobile domain-containing protein n=1 Tax=Fagus sylvatica TaxID=28930 RepID=A0A2N9EKT9_FAGSY